MKVLGIIESTLSDPSWIEEYTKNVTPMLEKFGGRYLTRSDDVTILEGNEMPQFSVVTEFPSKKVALEFYHSKEYEPYKLSRQKGSSGKFLLVTVTNGTE